MVSSRVLPRFYSLRLFEADETFGLSSEKDENTCFKSIIILLVIRLLLFHGVRCYFSLRSNNELNRNSH